MPLGVVERRRAANGGQVGPKLREVLVRARELRQPDPVGELLERQPPVDDGVAQPIDGRLALGVGGQDRRMLRSVTHSSERSERGELAGASPDALPRVAFAVQPIGGVGDRPAIGGELAV
jgi:hypothetical protein